MKRHASLLLPLVLAAVAAGCGKPPPPKADAGKEQKEALERAKEGAFGTQVQSLEAAKGLGADMDKKAREAVEKAEQEAK